MLNTHIPSESELMVQAHRALKERIAGSPPPRPATEPTRSQADQPGPSPERTARRERSLQTCHRYSLDERPRHARPEETGAYVPALSATLENDSNLTDGARRLARKLAEVIYRQNRAGRFTEITVTYLMNALRRSRRTIQRYLRLLEREGYIHTQVVRGARSRLCTGLLIALCQPLFARHHQQQWPCKLRNPGASKESQNYRTQEFRGKGEHLSVRQWSFLCMEGVFRAFMKTDPPSLMKKAPPLTG
ncbi:MAG: HTH domain-containing protein [Hyphomicrobiales bacterium]|nr:HTH domain-containing protein [Hyphomicrobiales bacterium]